MKALALVDEPDHVCCRYRVGAFAPALARAGVDLVVEGLARGLLGRSRQLHAAGRYDAVLLQRKLLSPFQLATLRRRAPRLVFDFDDAIPHRDSYDDRGPLDRRRGDRFARVVRIADAIIAGNAFLADLAERSGADRRRIRVIPTCVDPRSYPRSAGSGRGDGITLVWIGSSSTLRGLEREAGLFDRLALAVPGLRLRVIADRSASLGRMVVEFSPWSEATERAAIAGCDAGISLVPDDLWSRGKCGLKLLQYQAAGLPVVANPVGVHPEIVEDGVTGYLASTADDWASAIGRLASDPSHRRSLGAAGRGSLIERYAVDRWSSRFVEALTGAGPGAHAPPRRRASALDAEPAR